MESHPVFLFGSGISIDAGMPDTRQITEVVLSGRDISRHTDGRYYKSISGDLSDKEYRARALEYIKLLKAHIAAYYKEKKEITYEDLYYLAFQITEDLEGEAENPGIRLLLEALEIESKSIQKKKREDIGEWDLARLASEGRAYIAHAIRISLTKEGDSFKPDFASWLSQGHVDIFTLNHDLLLENFFAREGQNYIDGFSEPMENVRWWEPGAFVRRENLPHLVKLHGSLNWYFVRRKSSDFLWTPAIRIGR